MRLVGVLMAYAESARVALITCEVFNRRQDTSTAWRVPVVSIQMPPEPNLRDLYEEILAGMGGIFSPGTSVTTLRHRIRALAEQLEVHMLIVDEIHALLNGTPRQQRII